MRLVSLALGGMALDVLGVQPIFWVGGVLLALAGLLGLAMLGAVAGDLSETLYPHEVRIR